MPIPDTGSRRLAAADEGGGVGAEDTELDLKSEARRPKPEGRKKAEFRRPKPENGICPLNTLKTRKGVSSCQNRHFTRKVKPGPSLSRPI